MSAETKRVAREAQVAILNLLNKAGLYPEEERDLEQALTVARSLEKRN